MNGSHRHHGAIAKRRRCACRDAGQALVLVLLLVLVLAVVVATVLSAVLGESNATLDADYQAAAKQAALSGASWVAGNVESSTSASSVTSMLQVSGVWHVVVDGSVVSCGQGRGAAATGGAAPLVRDQGCFKARLVPGTDAADPGVKTMTVTVLGRNGPGCPTPTRPRGTPNAPCAYERVQVRLRQWSFFDALIFDDYESLDPYLYTSASGTYPSSTGGRAMRTCATDGALPASCKVVAFTSADAITGPVRTNGSTFYMCGHPTFGGPVITTGPVALSAVNATVAPQGASSCNGSSPSLGGGGHLTPDALPYAFPFGVSPLKKIAAPEDIYSAPSSPLTVTFSHGSYTVDGQRPPDAWPTTGVLYVTGSVRVKGTVCASVSVAATGNIEIPANLTVRSGCHAAIGLEAANSVVVTTYDPHANRVIDAAVVALGTCDRPGGPSSCPSGPQGGSFYVQGYNTDKWRSGTTSGGTTSGGTSHGGSSGGNAFPAGTWSLTISERCNGDFTAKTEEARIYRKHGSTYTLLGTLKKTDFSFSTTFTDETLTGTLPAVSAFGPTTRLYVDVAMKGGSPQTHLFIERGAQNLMLRTPAASAPAGARLYVTSSLTGTAATMTTSSSSASTTSDEARTTLPGTGSTNWYPIALGTPSGEQTGSTSTLQTPGGHGAIWQVPSSGGTTSGGTSHGGSSGAKPPVLTFHGAIAEIWRGAYGTYLGNASSPTLVTGYAKHFTYDRTLLTTQPPYFLEPVGSNWEEAGAPLVAPCTTPTSCT